MPILAFQILTVEPKWVLSRGGSHCKQRMGRCGGEDVERETLGRSHRSGMGHDGERDLLYIDLHLVHEVTSPQAFDGLISWALGLSPGSARVRLQAMEEGLDEIGSRFAGIARNNSANNGLLLAQVDPEVVEELWDFAEQHPGEQLTVSLENRTISLPGRLPY